MWRGSRPLPTQRPSPPLFLRSPLRTEFLQDVTFHDPVSLRLRPGDVRFPMPLIEDAPVEGPEPGRVAFVILWRSHKMYPLNSHVGTPAKTVPRRPSRALHRYKSNFIRMLRRYMRRRNPTPTLKQMHMPNRRMSTEYDTQRVDSWIAAKMTAQGVRPVKMTAHVVDAWRLIMCQINMLRQKQCTSHLALSLHISR